VVTNPPYLGKGFCDVLKHYVNEYYVEGKADLCTCFTLRQGFFTAKNGYYANIIPPSWMFLSTFEGLRRSIIEKQTIQSLLHLSRGVFGADFGSVSCVIQNKKTENASGTYFRLIERTFQEFDEKHLQQLYLKTLADHDFKFLFANYTKDVEEIIHSENGAKIYYTNINQSNFEKIPGCPIGYWVSENTLEAFTSDSISSLGTTRKGMATGLNARFVRLWHEVSKSLSITDCKNRIEAKESIAKWFPYANGGGSRKWYGNFDSVVDWENDGEILQTELTDDGSRVRAVNLNLEYIFNKGISWTSISSSTPTMRYLPEGFLFSSASNAWFGRETNLV
jgi:hypothetical protein